MEDRRIGALAGLDVQGDVVGACRFLEVAADVDPLAVEERHERLIGALRSEDVHDDGRRHRLLRAREDPAEDLAELLHALRTRRSGLSPCSPSNVKLGVRRRVHLDGAAPGRPGSGGAEPGNDDRRQTDGERDERAEGIA